MQYLPNYSDDNTVCALIATYGSDDGTIKTKDDDATYAGKCSPLITNVGYFCNQSPLPVPKQYTAGKTIVQARNMREIPMAATSVNTFVKLGPCQVKQSIRVIQAVDTN